MDILINVIDGNKEIRCINPVSKPTLNRWRKSLGVELIENPPGTYFYLQKDLQLLLRFAMMRSNGKDYNLSILEILGDTFDER